MRQQSVPLRAIAGKTGMHHGYTRRLLTEQTAEDALLWLIQVGLLRREVDGQGITDSRLRITHLPHTLNLKRGAVHQSSQDEITGHRHMTRFYSITLGTGSNNHAILVMFLASLGQG